MAKGIVLLDHSFRPNSRILQAASQVCDQVAVVYYSPYYWSPAHHSFYSNPQSHTKLHHLAVRRLHQWLEDRDGGLNIFKVTDPASHLGELIDRHGVDLILSDMPQFGRGWALPTRDDVMVESIDSSTYDPVEKRKTASSRVRSWRGGHKISKVTAPDSWPDTFELSGCEPKELPKWDIEGVSDWIDRCVEGVEINYKTYGETRDHRWGSTRVSGLIQHGLIDPPSLVRRLLELDPVGEDSHALLRQLAFREISLQKTREAGLHPDRPLDDWLVRFMDEKSLAHLDDFTGDSSLTRDELFAGDTGDQDLDKMIQDARESGWMPNRARLFMAGEVLHRMGGRRGIQVLIDFFNLFTLDGQAPMSWIGPIECAKLNYGRVIRYNRKKALKLLYG